MDGWRQELCGRIAGFYGVVDLGEHWARQGSIEGARTLATELIAGGACVLQLRMKKSSTSDLLLVARALRELDTVLIIDDRVDVALAAGADGVHLGQDDLPLDEARAVTAERLLIGVSTHSPEQVKAAVAGGADYLGFGPVFATTTKKGADATQGVEMLAAAVEAARPVPVVAIGGITPENARRVAKTGARALCAISSVNHSGRVAKAAASIAAAWRAQAQGQKHGS